MKIENITPNIIQLKFYQEKTDNDYGSCLWGNVVIDCANYTLLIESDCGSYSYGWTPTPNTESFVKLLCRMNSDYLLGKISDMTYFDFEKSKEQTYKNIREYFEYDGANKSKEIIEKLDYHLDLDYGEGSFYRACEEAFAGYNICDSFEIIHIEKDYPAGAKKIADIFKSTIQPYLRKNFLNGKKVAKKDYNPCNQCRHKGWDMPQCHYCNKANEYKYMELDVEKTIENKNISDKKDGE